MSRLSFGGAGYWHFQDHTMVVQCDACGDPPREQPIDVGSCLDQALLNLLRKNWEEFAQAQREITFEDEQGKMKKHGAVLFVRK